MSAPVPPDPAITSDGHRSDAVQYAAIGFLLWVLVDVGTAGGFRLAYLRTYGPTLLMFYIGCPVAMAYLIFRRRWSGRVLLWAICAQILLVEGLFTRNPIVVTFPWLLIGLPLALCIYAPLTYFPLWLVRREMREHWRAAVLLSAVVAVVMVLTTFGKK